MITRKFNSGWKYWKDKDSFALVWTVPDDAVEVTLPHDAMIGETAHEQSRNGGNTGFLDSENLTYVKTIDVPLEYEGKEIILKLEGSYMNTFVYVNGQLAGKNPYGYTGFTVRLNDFLNYGCENEIRIQVRAGAMNNSRWYSGAGIYRDVYLLISDPVHIEPDGIRVTTENIDDGKAVICVETELRNSGSRKAAFSVKTEISNDVGNIVAEDTSEVVIESGKGRINRQRILIRQASLWSAETPILYNASVKLIGTGADVVLDQSEATFGIRILQLDSSRGLRVNGQTVKLRGACIHHDSGLFGAAVYEAVEFRQIHKLKEAGFNAVRMSHHPMAPAMLRACDFLGMYVMDEYSDMWTRMKGGFDYGLVFDEWWKSDVEAMVRQDYNHPCVIMYSVGNEIPEIGTDRGSIICNGISGEIHMLDHTRYTTAGINGVFAAGDAVPTIMRDVVEGMTKEGKTDGNVNDFMTIMDSHMDEIVVHDAITERLDKACASLDIAGYNYMTARYRKDAVTYPERIMVGTETYPPEIARNWKIVRDLPSLIGDFTWTGWDYRGEAGIGIPSYKAGDGGFGARFPAQIAYVGDIDITGYRRPMSYYREIVFGLRKNPYIAVQDPSHYGEPVVKTPWVLSDTVSSWTWKGFEDHRVIVEVYSAGTETELFLNGRSLGRKESGESTDFRTLFETEYKPGTLKAVTYDENGEQTGESSLGSAGSISTIVINEEKKCGGIDANDFMFFEIALTDRNGNVVTDEDEELMLSIDGNVELMGFGSGDPKPAFAPKGSITRTWNGRGQLIIKRITDKENVRISISDRSGRKTVREFVFE